MVMTTTISLTLYQFVLCLLFFRCLCLCLVCDCDDDDCSNPHSGTMCFPGKIPISMGIRANNIFGLISKIFQFMSKFIFFCKMNLVKTYSVQNTLQAKYYIEDVQVVILFHLPNVLFNLQMHDSVMTHKSAYSVFHQHFCVKNQIVHFQKCCLFYFRRQDKKCQGESVSLQMH